MNGIGTSYSTETGTYSGEFKNSGTEGVGRNVYLDGSVYIGEFRNGFANGKGIRLAHGRVEKGLFKND